MMHNGKQTTNSNANVTHPAVEILRFTFGVTFDRQNGHRKPTDGSDSPLFARKRWPYCAIDATSFARLDALSRGASGDATSSGAVAGITAMFLHLGQFTVDPRRFDATTSTVSQVGHVN
jgi:hypothetical protein